MVFVVVVILVLVVVLIVALSAQSPLTRRHEENKREKKHILLRVGVLITTPHREWVAVGWLKKGVDYEWVASL